jgi:hypothetical protein
MQSRGDPDDNEGEFLSRVEWEVAANGPGRFDPRDAQSDAMYQAAPGSGNDLRIRELRLLKRLADEIDARLPSGLSEDQQILLGQTLVRRNPDLLALVEDLENLAEANEGESLWRQGTHA